MDSVAQPGADGSRGTGATPPTLRERVAEVHRLRLAYAVAKAELDRRREEWEKANREWIGQVDMCAVDMLQAEAEARQMAVEIFYASGDKHPGPGLTIIERNQPCYSVPLAIQWAKDHDHPGLVREVLDEKAFQKVAKALNLPCVTWRVVAVGQLATDLSRALGEV